MDIDQKEIEAVKSLVVRYRKWFGSLAKPDQMNFIALINLDTAQEVIDKTEDGEYKEMATFAHSFLAAQKARALRVEKGEE